MIRIAVALAVVAGTASAAPPKVIVLPLDGDAPAAVRATLATDLAAAARANGGAVSTGTTTFDESAAAVGCDPATPACATTVLSTLGVDEVVFGTASQGADASTHVTLARVSRDDRQDRAFDLPPDGDADAQVRTLYGAPPPPPPPPTPTPPPEIPTPAPTPAAAGLSHDRAVGIGFAAGGGLAIVIGVALWASESSQQTQIDNAPNATLDDITALRALEDHASTYAWSGNVLFVIGLAAGGVGGYFLWRDHHAHAGVVPSDHGAAVTLEGTW